jgi:hypothetical protein
LHRWERNHSSRRILLDHSEMRDQRTRRCYSKEFVTGACMSHSQALKGRGTCIVSQRLCGSWLSRLSYLCGLCRKTTSVHAATSTRTSGWRSAIFKSCFAASDGLRRPCSHCSKVRVDTPTLRQVWPGKARSSNVGLLFFSSFDLPHTIQDFLPQIAFGLEGGECLSSQPLTHLFSILLCH